MRYLPILTIATVSLFSFAHHHPAHATPINNNSNSTAVAAAGASAEGGDAGNLENKNNLGDVITPVYSAPNLSLSYGYTVNDGVAPESSTVQLPLIGGGWSDQHTSLTPSGVAALADLLRKAQMDSDYMAALCATNYGRRALSAKRIECDD